jgi:tetratricopeptide (TPR) repeat protein
MSHKKIRLYACLFMISCFDLLTCAINEDIITGNASYMQGDYEKAVENYKKAQIDEPESPLIYFNLGNAYYKMDDFDTARTELEKAAQKTRDLDLETRAYYNMGDCSFRQAERQIDSDLKQAIKLFQESILYFQRALEYNPDFAEAAHNIEITRLILKDLLDKLKQQQEKDKNQQNKLQEIVEKIAALIEQEKLVTGYTRELDQEKQSKGLSDTLRKNIKKVDTEQDKIAKDTRNVVKDLEQVMTDLKQTQPDNPLNKANEYLSRSINFQDLARNQLAAIKLDQAAPAMQSAREELEKALDELTQGSDQSQQAQQENQPQQQQQSAQAAEQAEDILEEEEDDRGKRQQATASGYTAPAKDW